MIRFALQCQRQLCRNIHYSIRYTRHYFEDLAIDKKAIEEERKKQEQKIQKQSIHKLVFNDKNPNNFIKNLKVDHQVFAHRQQMQDKFKVTRCAILRPQPKNTKPVLISATRKYILTTLKKAKLAMFPIRKKYIFDAILQLQQSHKKVSKLMIPTLYNIIHHAIHQGHNPAMLFVHGYIIGKTIRMKGLRYHAKSKAGREEKDICQIKILVEVKNEKQFYEKVGVGEAPAGFANIVRQKLLGMNAGNQKLIQMSSITTAKGRQQKRELIKRRVFLQMAKNKEKMIYIPKKTVYRVIKQRQGRKILKMLQNLKDKDQVAPVTRRTKLFKKNMGYQE